MAVLNDEIIVTDALQCMVKTSSGEVRAFLHPLLSCQSMAKVCFEDGTWRDVFWGKIRQLGVSEEMDDYCWEDE